MFRIAVFLAALALSALARAEVEHIDNQALQALLAQGVPVIDIRRAEEWQATGVIENSHLLTFFDKQGRYNLPEWLAALGKIVADKDQPFILICRTGNRTGQLSRVLGEQLGYRKVYNVSKGITDWKRQQLPVAQAPQKLARQ